MYFIEVDSFSVTLLQWQFSYYVVCEKRFLCYFFMTVDVIKFIKGQCICFSGNSTLPTIACTMLTSSIFLYSSE